MVCVAKHNVVPQVLCDVDSGKEFILCEYNRDADSYRYKLYHMLSLNLVKIAPSKWRIFEK